MSETRYAYQGYDEDTMTRVYGRSLPVSTKKSVEVCRLIRGRSVAQAKALLSEVVALKRAVPYKRYNQELAHQKNTGSGGFPVAVCENIIKLLRSAEANASAKGLDEDSLKIVHSCAHLASRPMRYGRKRRVKAKRTHIEIVVKAMEKSKKTKAAKKPAADKPAAEKSEAGKTDADANKATPVNKASPAKNAAEKPKVEKPTSEGNKDSDDDSSSARDSKQTSEEKSEGSDPNNTGKKTEDDAK